MANVGVARSSFEQCESLRGLRADVRLSDHSTTVANDLGCLLDRAQDCSRVAFTTEAASKSAGVKIVSDLRIAGQNDQSHGVHYGEFRPLWYNVVYTAAFFP